MTGPLSGSLVYRKSGSQPGKSQQKIKRVHTRAHTHISQNYQYWTSHTYTSAWLSPRQNPQIQTQAWHKQCWLGKNKRIGSFITITSANPFHCITVTITQAMSRNSSIQWWFVSYSKTGTVLLLHCLSLHRKGHLLGIIRHAP